MPIADLDVSAGRAARSTAGPWAVALAGFVSLALAMGIGRFAFTPLLPMMLHDGTVTLNQGGALATWNYIGYLLGALLCLVIRPDPARMVKGALALTVVLTLAMALPGGMPAWLAWRTVSGIASAVVMVYATAWCMQRLAELGHPTLGGLMFCGPGIGIVVTGVSAFGMVGAHWQANWGWIAFTILGALMLLPVWRVFGTPSPELPPASHGARAAAAATPRLDLETWALTLAYGLAGFGYIITATFLPVIARHEMPGSVWADLFWPILGAGVAVGAWLVTRMGMHHDNRRMMMWLYAMQAVGVAVAAVWPTVAGFALSSLLVGLPFTALVSFAMREARRLWGASASKLIGLMTAAYAIGQIAGPPLATALVARTGGFGASLGVASGALLCGALIYFWMWRTMPVGRRAAG
ncbi:YbfB/YjiJ family MFS transporter [Cupriavidus agavae]|uniref:Putative MFS family arabinose efflux permease n=1 Tax=Cupriavidus agavae TaxID=1001822 RepID=A0A4Q7S4W9_9BURK|nr:YbfB/YjiJ family MFS transporter [Cupriavidus agavae]RZT41456.1 putative MFS family arabinose efflux permease [Cupriavidus agavae]